MKPTTVAIVLILICCFLKMGLAQMKLGFYNSTCPPAESIVSGVVQESFDADRSITAALLHMYFHDCFVRGCDASILIDSTKSNPSEKDAAPNLSVRAYDLIDEAKSRVEAACPAVVSCADIIALATRDAVALASGPAYAVPTGRRDGLVSHRDEANEVIPGPLISVADVSRLFSAKGLTLHDMVTLAGAHTVGEAHCPFTRIPDSSMDPQLAQALLRICGVTRPSDVKVFLDQGSDPETWLVLDNQYFNQTVFKRGVMQIDQALALDKSTASIVERFASDGRSFGESFGDALIKLGNVDVLVGNEGEIRINCRVVNPHTNNKFN